MEMRRRSIFPIMCFHRANTAIYSSSSCLGHNPLKMNFIYQPYKREGNMRHLLRRSVELPTHLAVSLSLSTREVAEKDDADIPTHRKIVL